MYLRRDRFSTLSPCYPGNEVDSSSKFKYPCNQNANRLDRQTPFFSTTFTAYRHVEDNGGLYQVQKLVNRSSIGWIEYFGTNHYLQCVTAFCDPNWIFEHRQPWKSRDSPYESKTLSPFCPHPLLLVSQRDDCDSFALGRKTVKSRLDEGAMRLAKTIHLHVRGTMSSKRISGSDFYWLLPWDGNVEEPSSWPSW